MSRTIQMFRCGPDMVKIIAPPARESIVPLAITLAERERENQADFVVSISANS